MSTEHMAPLPSGEEQSLRLFLDSLREPAHSLEKARKILRRKGAIALNAATRELASQTHDDGAMPEIQQYVESSLNDYNDLNRLLIEGDEVLATGNLFVRVSAPDGQQSFALLNTQYRLSGHFEKIVALTAPPDSAVKSAPDSPTIPQQLNHMPALRLADVTLSEYDGKVTEVRRFPQGSFDIPLHYSDMTLTRLETPRE